MNENQTGARSVSKHLKTIIIAIAAALAALVPSVATAMTVQPVVLNLSPGGRTMSQVVTVTNSFAYPLAVELRVEELALEPTGVRGTGRDPGDLVVFPPTAMIQPGQTQTFRVQYVGDPALARSKHYYVTVAQLPVKMQQGQSAVQVLYNFQVLVSVAPTGAKPQIGVASAQVERTGDGKTVPAVTFTNPSNAHGYLSNGRIRIVQKDASGKEVFRREFTAPEVQQAIGYGLIGAGQTRKVTLPLELPSATGSVEAQYTPVG
ncbi:molecular chaperone [Sphingomonas sinipercae]|uniref:Molecular chaperone n=1 Tax=Sphingomonas sinipercae TaxID=2714944 RepID=A0A6G7ZKA3_9SPHN|nr:fimbria/pilus periplasmic chaperone [Sphingomonas sinipercae]QIL01363.1 molecular chaperone [Sphingomonas sinipercae]